MYFPFSVIGLSETKIKFGEQPLTNIDLPGYTFVSQNTLSNAGGVGFYVRNDLTFTVLAELSCTTADYEALWIEIQNSHGHNIICGVIYRHPNDNLGSFLDYLNSTAECIDRGSKYCTVLGDFNVDLLKIEKHQPTDDFLNTMSSFCFQPQILQPTRITDHSATLIDNIFFNSLEHFTISGNVIYDISDHLPNFLIFDKFSSLSNNVKLYKRDYSHFNQQHLLSELQVIDWHSVFLDQDASNMFSTFYDKISAIIDKHIPLKLLSKKERRFLSKPWISTGLRKSIYIKNKLYKKFLKSKSIYTHAKFKLYRNKLNHL